ncbi:hypothetical protein [Streptomyces sp. MUM 2J]|uniref:hypothetical protein n=1 Tax=Streptomyces sp. MUM 2J TaxID=2791987 RepID=UPI001F039C37|nr:hypothetical protein [Streptomyces sp. MUM 2J]MCH0567262.1 hypothetical protein [Streptomyces sp. MUM 2J]
MVGVNPAWNEWVGKSITLADGRPAVIRMARREAASDTLWAVDDRGTMRQFSARRVLRNWAR